MLKRNKYLLWISFFASLFPIGEMWAQASIEETIQSIKTYPYDDPNPIPVMGINEKVSPFYPYYVFDGYTDKGVNRDWKVIKMENSFVEVTVLPEVGGKVMGAIEKSTGHEFVYLNHVMKFRAIGIRGPWTSGGIEHNFGLDLGHAPWAAAPVDYLMKKNTDGSISCFVGGLDLASRTQWRVEIRLPKDKAYFETRSLWYNPTPLHGAYLSWENAAYKATDDLQFYFPGTHHIDHDGSAAPWPIDKNGTDLSLYKNNNFGGHKSYHVMGTHTDWFGGYWHDSDFGFGHWAPYADAPGRKLWIWSLARDGAIWEDLLTDSDGQYIEAQSGVKFNQAAGNSGFHSPFNQLSLKPFYTETKTELWFPVKAAEGMVDASPEGTLNVAHTSDSLKIAISPISAIEDHLKISLGNRTIYTEKLRLRPMQVYRKSVYLPQANTKNENLKVSVGKGKLLYTSLEEKQIDRPVKSPDNQAYSSAERSFRLGEDENAMRNYDNALTYYKACLAKEPTHSGALTRIAELHYRKVQYAEGLEYVEKVLRNDTYDGGANYMYGVLQRNLGNLTKAVEALGVAARTMEYRSGAYTEMAGIYLQMQDYGNAKTYAQKALDYNRNNLMAYELLATGHRKLNDTEAAQNVLGELLAIDPLNHYANFERYLLDPTPQNRDAFKSLIRNELPYETYLELAIQYANQGLEPEATKVLENAPEYPTVFYWLAYLQRDSSKMESRQYLDRALQMSPNLVFPFRSETLPVLDWAQSQLPSWKNNYYSGLIYWGKSDLAKAKDFFDKCKDEPDYAAFYMARGLLFQDEKDKDVATDLKKANTLDSAAWRTWHTLTEYFYAKDRFGEASEYAKKAYRRFPDNPILGMDYAKALLNMGEFDKSVQVLTKIHILPQEGAREGHDVYVLAQLSNAMKKIKQKKYADALKDIEAAKQWPENLGTGKPYDPDTHLQDYMASYCEAQLGHQKKADQLEQHIINYSQNSENWNTYPLNNYLGITLMKKRGRETEANQLIEIWESKQDSLKNWDIGAGSSSPEVRWVLAKYKGETKTAENVKRGLLADKKASLDRIFFEAVWLFEELDKKN